MSQSQIPEEINPAKKGWTVNEWSADTSICVTNVYDLLKKKRIRSVRFGGRRIILTPPSEFLASLVPKIAS